MYRHGHGTVKPREIENRRRGPTFRDFVTMGTEARCRTSQLQDYRVREYRLPSPPLLNEIYCVKVSLWTVKIFLVQH